jgi:hypothetical protein
MTERTPRPWERTDADGWYDLGTLIPLWVEPKNRLPWLERWVEARLAEERERDLTKVTRERQLRQYEEAQELDLIHGLDSNPDA